MPRVLWRLDNGDRQVFQSIEEFELHLAQSIPYHLGPLINLAFALVLAVEVALELSQNVAPGSYRGIFYRRYGPLNAWINVLRQLIGPRGDWGVARIIHEPHEPGWPRHHNLD